MLQGVQYSDCPALERTVGPIMKTVELWIQQEPY